MDLSAAQRLSMYRSMLRIRKLQLRIEAEYHLDEMKTPVHLCIGQEAIAVGVCGALRRDDNISSNHRSHGHYLAKGGDLPRLVAELYCKATGCSGGRGGSMHLVDTSVGHLGSSSIVGGGIPIATGLGLAAQLRGEDRVSVAFFGDGAADEGVLYESINYAVLKQLPVIYVLENNGWSVCSPTAQRQGWGSIYHHAPPEHLPSALIDGNAVEQVYQAAHSAVKRARAGRGPSFIECKTYRMRGHAGAGSDAHLGHRTEEEIAVWAARDPLLRNEKELRRQGLLDDNLAADMDRELDHELEQAFRFAVDSPLPRDEDLSSHLYAE